MGPLNAEVITNVSAFHARYEKQAWFAWFVWGLGAALFFSEYIVRISPSVMQPYLMRDFHVSAFMLGSLSAFFYYPYVAMQIPVGMLVDRYGPSRLLLVTAILFSFSCFLFATATQVGMAEISRFLMGFSASFAFVSTLKLALNWFPATRFGLLAGLTQALGMLGASVGDAPASLLIQNIGWRSTMDLVAVVFLVLGAVIWLCMRDAPTGHKQYSMSLEDSGHTVWQGLKIVVKNPQTWLNGAYVGLLYAPTAAVAELWGVAFLHDSFGIGHATAAFGVGLIFIGFAIGGPLGGWFSDTIGQRRPVMIGSAILCFVTLTTIIYGPVFPMPVLYTLLFLLGLGTTGVAVGYALSSEINPHTTVGTSLAFANMSSVIIGAILQPIIGAILDYTWDGRMLDGARVFNAHDFHVALFVLPLFLGLALLTVFFIKETHCRPLEAREGRSVI